MKVSIPDATYELYGNAQSVNACLLKAEGIPPSDYILLKPKDVAALRDAFGGATIKDAGDIVGLAKKASGMSLYGVDFQFTPDQLRRMKDQADFYQMPLADYVSKQIADHLGSFFMGF